MNRGFVEDLEINRMQLLSPRKLVLAGYRRIFKKFSRAENGHNSKKIKIKVHVATQRNLITFFFCRNEQCFEHQKTLQKEKKNFQYFHNNRKERGFSDQQSNWQVVICKNMLNSY